MNRQIQETLAGAEGRYLTKAEQAVLREHAARLDARLTAMEEVQGKEEAIIEQLTKEILRAYPDFEQKYKHGRKCCVRDTTLVLRYAVQAMVRADLPYLDDALLTWMGTILRGVGFTANFVEDTYKTLERIAERELSPAAAELLRPYLAHVTTTLSGAVAGRKRS